MIRGVMAGLSAAALLAPIVGCGADDKPVPKLQAGADVHAKAQPVGKAGKKNAGAATLVR